MLCLHLKNIPALMKVFAVRLDSYVQLANGNFLVNGYTESTKWVGPGLMGDPYKDNTVKCSIPTRSAPVQVGEPTVT